MRGLRGALAGALAATSLAGCGGEYVGEERSAQGVWCSDGVTAAIVTQRYDIYEGFLFEGADARHYENWRHQLWLWSADGGPRRIVGEREGKAVVGYCMSAAGYVKVYREYEGCEVRSLSGDLLASRGDSHECDATPSPDGAFMAAYEHTWVSGTSLLRDLSVQFIDPRTLEQVGPSQGPVRLPADGSKLLGGSAWTPDGGFVWLAPDHLDPIFRPGEPLSWGSFPCDDERVLRTSSSDVSADGVELDVDAAGDGTPRVILTEADQLPYPHPCLVE